MNMTEKKSWDEFRSSGMLWWINMILHTFGWAITVEVDQDDNVTNAYPSRVKFRGFSEDSNTAGYQNVSNYLAKNADTLLEESKS